MFLASQERACKMGKVMLLKSTSQQREIFLCEDLVGGPESSQASFQEA